MLTDKNIIDQLFRAKLRDYEVTPPVSLWNHIVIVLIKDERVKKLIILKRIGIAATVLSAFLVGWWLNNSKVSDEALENMATLKAAPKTELTNQVAPKKISSMPDLSVVPDNLACNQFSAEHSNALGQQFKPSISSIASFASNTSFLYKKHRTPLNREQRSYPT